MPKDTFFRLPDDKRNRILKGAKKEFYNCTFSEASINRIIKDAEIPRGSFYQYFEDKKDLYLYVIEENIKSVISNFGNKLEHSEGDIFLCVDNFISELLDETTKKAKEIKMIFSESWVFEAVWTLSLIHISSQNANSSETGESKNVKTLDTSKLTKNKEYKIGTYNVGFGAYTPTYSFFMDGGKYSRCFSKQSGIDAINGAADYAMEEKRCV